MLIILVIIILFCVGRIDKTSDELGEDIRSIQDGLIENEIEDEDQSENRQRIQYYSRIVQWLAACQHKSDLDQVLGRESVHLLTNSPKSPTNLGQSRSAHKLSKS